MPNEEMLSYIKDSTHKGFSREEITIALKNAEWRDEDITAAFEFISAAQAPITSPLPPIPTASASTYAAPPGAFSPRTTASDFAYVQEKLQKTSSGFQETNKKSTTGIVAFMISNNLASTKGGAQLALGSLGLLAFIFVYWLLT